MSAQQIRGTVLKARLAFIEDVAGNDGVGRVLAAMPPEDQQAFKLVMTISWYPFALGTRLDQAIVTVLGGGDPAYFERLGEASASRNLATMHRPYLTKGDAHGFLSKAPQIYRMYYEVGRREYERTGEREGVLTTFDAETFSVPDCSTVVGWHRRALEMCEVKGATVVEEQCRAKGAPNCRYKVSWS
ncbi:MAG: hypothetical protein JWL60_2486 [Gemmatimonadetes bacterium]|jgi:uncharacterized protein (TIGR02265 family)|nr:hypothetical protein [Gemmatimonadota bacterium]